MDALSVHDNGRNTAPVSGSARTGDRFGNHADVRGRVQEPGMILLALFRSGLRSAARTLCQAVYDARHVFQRVRKRDRDLLRLSDLV